MASGVTGNKTAQKRSSSAGNPSGKKNGTGRSNHTGNSKKTNKVNSSKSGSRSADRKVNNNKANAATSSSKTYEEEEQNGLGNEIRFFIAIGITILVTMCNFHYCMGVGNAVYFILHGLFGWLAYILPFFLLAEYLFMLPNRGSEEAAAKIKLSTLLFLECCCLFHFVGISDSQPFSPVYYFMAGQSGINGGLAGGLFSGLLQHLIGTVATILIIFILMLVTVIVLTERSAVSTMKTCAGSIQSMTGDIFQKVRNKFAELYADDGEDEYEEEEKRYRNGEDVEDTEDTWQEFAEDNTSSAEWNFRDRVREEETGKWGNTAAGTKNRSFTWEWKTSGTGKRPTEFFTQKFPFMSDVSKKMKESSTEKRFGETKTDNCNVDKHYADDHFERDNNTGKEKNTGYDFSDENWRKGFSSSRTGAASIGSQTFEKAGSVHRASSQGRPGSGSARIVLERDSRSLMEMGFEEILQEEEPQITGSIDDFIVFNGLMQSSGEEAFQEDTYSDPEDETHFQLPRENAPETDLLPSEEETGECDFQWPGGETDTAVDITEHVVLPEDGPVVRASAETDAMPLSGIQPAGNRSSGSDSIWKQSSGSGSRESSGAVTFSSKPKPGPAKPVLKRPYVFPPASLLKRNTAFSGGLTGTHREIQKKLYDTLQSFGVKVNMGMISVGPAVTRYELEPEPGVKVSRIVALQDDIKLALAASDIRIEAPIPGKSAIGIEVPNHENTVVGFRELIEAETFRKHPSRVAVAVGRDIGGQIIVADLAKMPHLLIAGATGSGKSVCINTLIMSIIYKATPEEVKLVMVDPKVVELSIYNGIPHLLVPVVTDARKAANALRWAVDEMNDRYKKFAEYNVRNIEGYNEYLRQEKAKNPANDEPFLYQMVIIVDELADLMMVAQSEVEEAICRLAQMARAAGIHLVLATQRPSVNVITGLIKANVPSRIAFAVSSGVDSRTIIDMNGAEKLLGKGDMLFYPYGLPKPVRVQGAFISDEEVSRVVTWLHKNNGEVSGQEMMEKMITSASDNAAVKTERDEYFENAARFIIEKDKASIGALQRNFKIGFNRAARIMDQLAASGVVGEEDGTKPRKILMSMDEFNQYMEEQ